LQGESDNLYSSFHLKYNMILNMTRVEGISPEYILQRSFYQFQNTACLPVLEEGKEHFMTCKLFNNIFDDFSISLL
jgi:superfamily II RNA helicase